MADGLNRRLKHIGYRLSRNASSEKEALSVSAPYVNAFARLTRHHSKPVLLGLQDEPKGPVTLVCRRCHDWIHVAFSNAQLHRVNLAELKAAFDNEKHVYARSLIL